MKQYLPFIGIPLLGASILGIIFFHYGWPWWWGASIGFTLASLVYKPREIPGIIQDSFQEIFSRSFFDKAIYLPMVIVFTVVSTIFTLLMMIVVIMCIYLIPCVVLGLEVNTTIYELFYQNGVSLLGWVFIIMMLSALVHNLVLLPVTADWYSNIIFEARYMRNGYSYENITTRVKILAWKDVRREFSIIKLPIRIGILHWKYAKKVFAFIGLVVKKLYGGENDRLAIALNTALATGLGLFWEMPLMCGVIALVLSLAGLAIRYAFHTKKVLLG